MQSKTGVTIEDVRGLISPPNSFLCEVGANKYSLQFLKHSISDLNSGKEYFTFR